MGGASSRFYEPATHDAQSTISVLPPENLAHIFKFVYCPQNQPRPKDLLSLGAVCSRWRRVAWSTPELWTYLCLERDKTIYDNFNSGSGDVGFYPDLLHLFYGNIGSLSMSITFDGWTRISPTPAVLEACLEIILKQNGSRLKELVADTCDLGNNFWECLFEFATLWAQFPQLERLKLDVSSIPVIKSPDEFDHLFMHSPQLRELAFTSYRRPGRIDMDFNWKSLTKLRLHCVRDISRVFEVLSQAPKLQEFYFYAEGLAAYGCCPNPYIIDHRNPPSVPRIPDGSNFVMEDMVDFSLKIFHEPWEKKNEDFALFKSFRFPNLKNLRWGDRLPSEEECPQWEDFFTSIPELTLLETLTPYEGYLPLWKLFPTLPELELRLFCVGGLSTIDNLTIKEDEAGTAPLPHLRSISITAFKVFRVPVGAITLMIASRRYGPVVSSSIALPSFDPIKTTFQTFPWKPASGNKEEEQEQEDTDRDLNVLQRSLIPEYNPSSSHWQNYTRLESFYMKFDDCADWKKSPWVDQLKSVCADAREVMYKEDAWRIIW
jgi:hypothetical protein